MFFFSLNLFSSVQDNEAVVVCGCNFIPNVLCFHHSTYSVQFCAIHFALSASFIEYFIATVNWDVIGVANYVVTSVAHNGVVGVVTRAVIECSSYHGVGDSAD